MLKNRPEQLDANRQWSILPATEKDAYIEFHRIAFEEDIRHAEKNVLDFPRWSILSGYYSMHNLTKLFLAQQFGIKISGPEVHSKTILALEHFVRDEKLKARLLALLKKAKSAYYSAERLGEKTLPAMLKRGKQERGKAQYYSEDYSLQEKTSSKKASYFLENIADPYIQILQELKTKC